ncbi:MAG: GNAT family N-acetyltransferase [Phycicoccus sp.]
MTGVGSPLDAFRPAVANDAEALLAAERAATIRDLAHVFPPERHPYPDDAVLGRWRSVLVEPGVRTLVAEEAGRVVCYVAHDREVLRHLGVVPGYRGTGLARAAVDLAVAQMDAVPRLWCLQGNHQALAFYGRLGWVLIGRERWAEFPPYPMEVELVLPSPVRRRPGESLAAQVIDVAVHPGAEEALASVDAVRDPSTPGASRDSVLADLEADRR